MKKLFKTFAIAIAALATNVNALAELPQRPDFRASMRDAGGAKPNDDFDFSEPIRVGKDIYIVHLVLSGKKCTVELRPVKNSRSPGRMEMVNMQCES